MNTSLRTSLILSSLGVMSVLAGCATHTAPLADGRNVRSIMTAQIEEPGASDRHGTAAPQGTDSEVSAASVRALRERSKEGAAKPSLFEALIGALAGK